MRITFIDIFLFSTTPRSTILDSGLKAIPCPATAQNPIQASYLVLSQLVIPDSAIFGFCRSRPSRSCPHFCICSDPCIVPSPLPRSLTARMTSCLILTDVQEWCGSMPRMATIEARLTPQPSGSRSSATFTSPQLQYRCLNLRDSILVWPLKNEL